MIDEKKKIAYFNESMAADDLQLLKEMILRGIRIIPMAHLDRSDYLSSNSLQKKQVRGIIERR